MKRLILLAALLASPAFAEESVTAPTTSPAPTATPTPATPPTTVWRIEELEAADINTINQCIMELPKKIADPFISKINAKLKPVR